MCGIAGVLSLDEPVGGPMIERALDALAHRGPDGRGAWISDDRSVGLGHVRLSLVDLEGGAQPIANEDGTIHATVNGEIYEHERLRAELEARGHRFRTRSDSEVLVHLYEEGGPACLEALRGELAFVLYDAREQMLFAARDRFGIKPLVYAEHRGRLMLASEAKALFAMGLPRAWDEDAFFEAASLQYVPPAATLFAGVRQLPPGHLLLARGGRVETRCYWDVDLVRTDSPRFSGSDAEAELEVRRLLEDAVHLRLRPGVPMAAQLSGGIDSSAVAGLAAQRARLECFTVAFEDARYDERALAAHTARALDVPLHVVEVSRRAMAEHLSDAVFFSEGLAINGHLPAKHLLARAIRDAGFKAVLSGEGADEAFLGYAHFAADLDVDPVRLAREHRASAGLMLPAGEGLPLDAVRETLGFVPSFLAAKATLGARVHALLRPELRARFATCNPYRMHLAHTDVARALEGRERVDVSRYLWMKSALAQYILRTLGDGTEMASSVEGRVPFLDHHLFAFARTLPTSMLVRDGVQKRVLREAVRDVVTDAVHGRAKHPFLAPPMLDEPLLVELVEDTLRGRAFREGPFFDPVAVRALLDRVPHMSADERALHEPAWMTVLTSQLLDERMSLYGCVR